MLRKIGISLLIGLGVALAFQLFSFIEFCLFWNEGEIYSPGFWITVPTQTFVAGAAAFVILHFSIDSRIRNALGKLRAMRTRPGTRTGDELRDLDREITEFSEERKQEQEHLKKLEDYRKEFLGNVSHELKTPIFNIQGYIHTLLDGGMDDPKINKDYLRRAANSVDRMIAIVEDLQAITQFESGELVLEQERFDMVALIKDVFDAQELKAREKKITFELVGNPQEPVYVIGDRFRIRQVLVNLVVNSVRYGKEGGNTQVRVHDIGEKIRIEVADNGIGISREHLPRIFERFYRADKSRSREMGGTGLGLAIVKHIMEGHGQTIEVMSTEGAGSVFSFTLKKADT
jgi:two-component system, OmpR family, phosphate regulon sensor histidine kinase PhoR